MMVEQMARQIAQEVIASEYGKKLIEAKKAYDEDLEAQKMLQDYTNFQNSFQNRLVTEDVSDEDKDAFYNTINDLNTAIKERKTTGDLYRAENDFNEYTQGIFNIITRTLQDAIAPENGQGCSPSSCSTCAGCN